MRHMCATPLKDLGVPARDAMSILGHSRITMTLEIYTASGDAAHRRALNRVSEALNRPPQRPPPSPGIGRRPAPLLHPKMQNASCYMSRRRFRLFRWWS